jgi:glycosyltransferase involved in cell wall biosynthesis
MRVLFVAPNYYPHIGGVEKHIRELSSELMKDGHQVTVLTVKSDPSYKDQEVMDNVAVFRLRRSANPFLNKLLIRLRVLRKLGLYLKSDVIHFHDFATFLSLGLILFPLLKLFGKKVYLTFHGWEGIFPPEKKTIILRKVCEFLTDGNICIGHFIEKWYGTKANIVSYGGTKSVAESHHEDHKYILFLGRLSPDTGILAYLDAWKTIQQIYPDFELVVCGDGELKETVVEKIRSEQLHNVSLKGSVQNPELYIKDASVVFVSGYLGILEAFSYTKSVVSYYDHPLKKDYLEMIPDSEEMMWVVGSVDEIRRSVNDSLKDNVKRYKGRDFSRKQTWHKVKEDYYRLWNFNNT